MDEGGPSGRPRLVRDGPGTCRDETPSSCGSVGSSAAALGRWMHMRRTRRLDEQYGFSLVEIMVVLVVLGVLMTIGLPVFLGARPRAQDRAAQARLQTG